MGSNSLIDGLNQAGAHATERLLDAWPLSRWATHAQRLSGQMGGHFWTLLPYGNARLTTLPLIGGQAYRHRVCDPQRGWVPIYGRLYRAQRNQGRLVILLHGLASTPTDPYLRQMIRALNKTGCDVLSKALRGSLGRSSDHYHAGLTDDLQAIFSDPRLTHYSEIFLVGYSLGGQMALRYAIDHGTSRLKGTVALCAPISMQPCQAALDSPALTPYRLSILSILKWTYHRLSFNARREGKEMSVPLRDIRKIRSFYEWDQTVVCSRYGYPSVEAYYEAVSSAPHLSALETPTLMIFGAGDPIVPMTSINPYLEQVSSSTDVYIVRPGGHLGFPARLDLGQPAPLGLPQQVAGWIQSIS